MQRRDFIKAGVALGVVGSFDLSALAQPPSGIMAPVLTRAMDNYRSGANLLETVLTQSSIKSKGIRKLFSLPMEGDRVGNEGQILIQPKVTMDDGTVRDICIVTSMNNLVYCFDANTSDILWVKKLGIPVNGSNTIDAYNINDHWGILSTGVIDPETNTWYGVSWTSSTGQAQDGKHYIHSLRLGDGSHAHPSVGISELKYQPVSGPLQSYSSIMRKQRASLVMTKVNGVKLIFLACGTVSESANGSAGWIIAFDVASNAVTACCTTTSGHGGGIWMAGSGLCADDAGNLYGITGNGTFDGVSNFGECIFKAVYSPGKLQIVDWWAPYTDSGRMGLDPTKAEPDVPSHNSAESLPSMPINMASMPKVTSVDGKFSITKPKGVNAAFADEDLGSAGVSLISAYGIVLGAGKDGIAYLVNMHNMGKTKPADFANASANYAKLVKPPIWYTFFPGYGVNAAPQDSSDLDFMYLGKTRHMHSTSVWFNSSVHGLMLFCCGENSPVRAWSLAKDGTMTFLAQSAEVASAQVVSPPGGMPGGFMCLSANSNKVGTALLWVCLPYGDANKSVTNGRLVCYDPENFVGTNDDRTAKLNVLWDSQAAGLVYKHNKFCPPVVSGGKVFLPTYEDEYIVLG